MQIDAQPEKVKKFYFLEYFYVLLKSVQVFSRRERIFERFLALKQEYQLGESRYKKLTTDDNIPPKRIGRYEYTFNQVLAEAEEYELLIDYGLSVSLTDRGKEAIDKYEVEGSIAFNRFLFQFMERKYHAFRHLLEVCNKANPEKHGLLIFPIYSAYRLGFERSEIRTSANLQEYFYALQHQLEKYIELHLGKRLSLQSKNQELLDKLSDLLPDTPSQPFEANKYAVILKRVRDFWLQFFLQELYNYQYPLSTFDIWAYRGKQIGVFHITEVYPGFRGRVLYPLSILVTTTQNEQFQDLFTYQDNLRLYLHQPSWENEKFQDEFYDALYNAYLVVHQLNGSYFVSLSSVRERVCYNLKIPEYLFDEYLGYAYRLSFSAKLKIRISLEVDKLPEETKLEYLMRPPVMIDGKYRNIIAIDLV
jgi:hypothetical protein